MIDLFLIYLIDAQLSASGPTRAGRGPTYITPTEGGQPTDMLTERDKEGTALKE